MTKLLRFRKALGVQRDLCTHPNLDGRNHMIVNAESLARVIAAIRITSVRWRSYLPKIQKLVLIDLAFVVLRLESRNWIMRLTCVPRGLAEWPARVDHVRWTLASENWRFCPSKHYHKWLSTKGKRCHAIAWKWSSHLMKFSGSLCLSPILFLSIYHWFAVVADFRQSATWTWKNFMPSTQVPAVFFASDSPVLFA